MMRDTRFLSRTIVWSGGIAILLLAGPASKAFAQPMPEAESDIELRKRLAPLIPSFQAALQGNSVDAQRATLSIIADIPPSLVVGTNLAMALKTFLQKDIKDPDILALGLRSFGRSFPEPADVETIIGRNIHSNDTIIRRAAAEGLASALSNSFPRRTAERKNAYFIDMSKRALPLLADGAEDKDAATQKIALGGIRSAADTLTNLYTFDTEPLDLEAKPKNKEARFAALAPAVQAFAKAGAKLATPLSSADPATRIAAARTLESLALLRKAIRTSSGPGEPEPADPFVGGWSAIRQGVTAGISDPNPRVRLAVTEAIESLGDALETRALMRHATKDQVIFVRWAAARALGESAPVKPDAAKVKPDVDALASLVDDSDIDVRTAAITALGKYGLAAKSATAKLVAAVGKGDIEPRVAAVTALGDIKSDAAETVPALIGGLKNDDLRLRRASATGLVRFGPAAKAALPELRRALANTDVELRIDAAEAVLAIEGQSRLKEL